MKPAVVGDHTALGRLILRSEPYVKEALYSQFGHGLLERIGLCDVVNETHVRVLEKFGTFQGGTNKKQFRSWMVTIAFRIVLDWIRKAGGGGRGPEEPVDVDDITPQSGKTPSSLVRHADEVERMARALARLSEKDRALIEWWYLRELTLDEIVKELEKSEGSPPAKNTVSQRRRRALDRLRKACEEVVEEESEPEGEEQE